MHSHSSMNRVYRIVWNESLSMWVAVAENAKGRSKGGTGRKRLAALLAAALGTAAGVMPPAMAGPLDGIVIDGRTSTQLNQPSANTVNITTTTVNGGNAFNSFSRFSVDAGNIANLHVPTGATNLINIVRDARTDINGVLNGIKDGRIGGNVWFANPYGLVVGAGGVVNVGSLNVSTPTAAFVQGFFGANGPNANYVQQLLNGTAPLNADGTVSILGRVNAINGVLLSAGAINVRGAIYSGARFIGTAPDFSDVVNANGLSVATGIVEQEGRIRIIATQTQGGKAAINLDGAQMLATSIELSATSTLTDASLAVTSGLAKAEAAASIDIQGSQLRTVENLTAQATTTVNTSTFTTPIAASVQRVDARATVNVGGSSQLTVGGDALLGATTSVSTNATPTSALANKAGDAAVAVSDVTSLAQVRVTDTTVAAVTGKLGLAAVNTVSTTSVADAAAAGNNAAGAAVAVSLIDSTTSAVIDGQAAITAGALDLSAASRNTATVTAKAASQGAEKDDSGSSQGSQTLAKYKDNASTADSAPGEGIKVAGAVAVSDLSSHTQALLASGQAAKVTGAVGLRSEEGNTVVVGADSSATNSATGVAAAVAINLAQLSNEAAIAQTLQAGSVSASAAMAAAAPVNSFSTTAVSGAGASNVGVAGSLAVNAIDSATTAALRGGANVTLTGAAADVALTARNASASTAKATPAAGGASGDKVGIGASVAVNVVGTRTLAQLADGAQLQGAREVALDAGSTHAVTTEAEAGSEGGISITPSVAVSIANHTTQASLGASSKLPLTLSGDLLLNAAQSTHTTTTAKGSAVGGKAAIGAAVAVALVDDLVEATTARAIVANGASGAGKGQVTFKAQGASASEVSATASASGGHKADDAGAAGGGEDASVDDKIGKQLALGKNKQSANKVGDSKQQASTGNAVQAQKDGQASASTSEGKISVAAAVGVNLQNSTARAEVPVDVTSAGALTLAASNNTDAKVVSDGSALPKADADGKTEGSTTQVGIGAAVSVNKVASVADAIVGGTAVIRSNGLSLSAGMTDVAGDSTHTVQTEAASGAGGSKVGIAGSLALNLVDTRSDAAVRGGAVVNAGTGAVALAAENNTDITAKAAPVDKGASGGKVGIGASVAVNITGNQSTAEIEDGATLNGSGAVSLDAKAAHKATTTAEAGSSGGVAITPALALAMLNNTTSARLGTGAALQGAGGVSLSATQSNTTVSTAKGSAAGETASIGAAVALALVNDLTSATTERDILGATGDVGFKAASSSDHTTTATASSKGGKSDDQAGKTGADGKKQEDATVDDKVDNQLAFGKTQQAKNGVGSSKQQAATGTAAGGKASAGTSEGKVSVAAAAAVNIVDTNTTASVADGRTVSTTGAFALAASGNTDAAAKSDGAAVGNGAQVGIGAAVSLNQVHTNTLAAVGSNTNIQANGVAIGATMTDVAGDSTHTVLAQAASGAGGSKVGIAGSLALNLIDTRSEALVRSGALVNAGTGAVAIAAENNTDITARAVPVDKGASGGKVGIGASVAVNITGNQSTAEIADGATLTGSGAVSLDAKAAHKAETTAEAGSAGGVAITPALALAMLNNTTSARLGTGAALQGTGAVTVSATQSNVTTTSSKGSAVGESAAIGAAVGIALVNDLTSATTERDILDATGDVRFKATASSGHTTTATASSKGGKSDDEAGKTGADGKKTEDATVDDKVDNQLAYGKTQQTQAKVGSTKQQTATGNAAGGKASASSSEGKVSVAAAVAVNVIDSSTTASVAANRTVSTTGAFELAASGNTDASAKSDGTAVGKTAQVGIGAAASVNQVNASTLASIGNDATVRAKGIAVGATMTDVAGNRQHELEAKAESGAGGSKVGIAASLALNIANTSSQALVGDRATLQAGGGDVSLTAEDRAKVVAQALPTTTGGASGGSVGVGVSVALNLIDAAAVARLGTGAGLTGARDLGVTATTAVDSDTQATSGAAGGKLAFDAAVAVTTLKQTTQALINSGAGISATGDVALQATSSGTHTATAKGEAKSGTAAIGAAAGVITSNSRTQAVLDRDLSAAGKLALAASATRAYTADATASAGGSQASKTYDDNKSQADSATSSKTLASNQNGQTNQGTQGGGKVAIAAAVGVNVLDDDVQAAVTGGRTLASGGAMSVAANNDSNFSARGAGDAVDAKTQVGVAVGVGISIANNSTVASLADNTHITKVGDLSVTAASTQNTSPEFARKLAAEGVAGAGASKVGVAGAFAVAVSNAQTLASIGANARIDQAGNIRLDATNTSLLGAKAWAAAKAGTVGVGASVATVVSNNQYKATLGDNAQVEAASLSLNAKNLKVSTPGVSLQVSGVDDIKNLPDRLTSGPLIGGTNYYTEAVSGAAGDNVSVAGAFAVNVFTDTTEAAIGNGARVVTTGEVALTSLNDTGATSLAAAAALAGKVGVGVSSAVVSSHNDTSAHIGTDADINGAGGIRLGATNLQDVNLIGFSGAAGGNVAVAGVANVLTTKNTAQAYIADSAATKLQSGGQLSLDAKNALSVFDIVSGVAVGGSVGVGVAAAVHTIGNDTRAFVGDGVQARVDGATRVAAAASEDLKTFAVGAAGAGSVAVGGAAIVNVLNAQTQAYLGDGVQLNKGATPGQQSVAVSASDDTTLFDVVAGAGGGGSVGGGAAGDVGVLSKTTQAWIGGNAWVEAGQNLTLKANSQEDLRLSSIGFGAGGSAGLAGSAAVFTLKTDTEARVGDGATLRARGNALVAADGRTAVDLIAGSAAAGGSAAVGAAAGVVVLDKTTLARIGENANVQALGYGTALQAATGHYDIAYGGAITGDGRVTKAGLAPTDAQGHGVTGRDAFNALTQQRIATARTEALQGLGVTATNSDSVKAYAVTGAGAGAAAITLGANVSTVDTDTRAQIASGAKINQTADVADAAQSVRVAAGNEQFHLGLAGAAAGAGAVAVGAGADVFVSKNTTQAAIASGAQVQAARDVQVLAEGQTQVLDMGVGLAAAGTVAVAGSVAVVSIANTTQALVGAGTTRIDAGGNVRVAARDDTQTNMVAGAAAAGIGAAGVGAAVGVSSLTKTTQAGIGDGVTVNALGNGTGNDMTALSGQDVNATVADARGVQVQATSSEDLFTVVASGAAGLYAGISGAISVESVRSDTQASIGNDTKINQANAGANAAQDVNVSARNQLRSQVVTGSVALGAGALAGAVDVGTVNNRTTASIGRNAQVTAARDIGVNALSRQDYTTTVVSGAGGLVGLAGGIAVYGIGEALSADATSQLSNKDQRNVNQEADAQASDDTVGRMLAASDDTRTRDIAATAQSKRSAVSISSSLSAPQPSGNAAQVGDGAVLVAGRDVGVNARGTLDFGMKTGAVAVGALGLGAGVGIGNFQLANQALVGNNVTIGAGGDLRVAASLAEKAQALGFAGTGGVVALNAAYASLADHSVTRAAIGNNLTIHKADEVLVNATDTRSLNAEAYGASVGAYVAGASIASSVIDGSTSASIGSNAQIGAAAGDAVRALTVEAASDVQAQSHAVAAAAGLGLALSGSVATAQATPEVSAFVTGGDIRLAQDARIAATGKTRANAESLGVNLSFTAAAGAAVATANAISRVDAYLGSGTQLSGRNLTVSATQQLAGSGPDVSANATGASGALFAGLTATAAHADTDSRVNSRVGDGSTLTLTGTAAVNALNNTRQQADASGFAGGIVAAGFNDARASSNTVTQASLGDNVQVAAPVANNTLMTQVALSAEGTDTNRANATSGSGGLVAGSAATATTAGTSLTQATTGSGDGSHRIAAKKFSLDARHTTDFNATVNSVNASVVGASGAKAVNKVDSTVTAAIGDNGVVSANEIRITASNSSRKDWIGSSNGDTAGFNVDSGSGGVIDLPAASSQTDISHITTAAIGAGAKVHALLPSAGVARLDMDAFNDIVARDKVRLDSGGLISVARSVSNVNVNRSDATVSFGDGASVTSDNGDINAGAHATVALDARAQANVYGLAGAPSGRAYAVYNGNNQAIVGTNALLRADDGSVMLSGGQGYDGTRTRIDANAAVNLWNKTAIPITTDPDAQANVNSNARVSLATGSRVESAEDIALYADKGIVSVNAKGIGKDLYREALAAIASGISNLFGGGDVSFDVIGGSTSSTGSAVVHVDGIAMTGINRRASLTFEIELIDAAGNPVSAPVYAKVFQTNDLGQFVDAAGNPTTDSTKYVEVGKQVLWRMKSTASKGVTYSVELGKGIGADIQERIMKLRSLMSQYASDEVARGAYQAEINFLMFKLVELGLASGATNADGTIKLDPTTGQPLINPGQWNNPSPRQIAETQIKQYQMQLMSETGKATGNGKLIQDTTTAAIGSANQIGASGSGIATYSGTLVTTNAGIDTQLKSLAGFDKENTTYKATVALIGDNTTQLTAIQTNQALNTNALTSIGQKNMAIDGLLTEIGGIRADMQALAYGSAAYMAKQAEIDTRQASILARAGEIKTLLTSVSTQSAAIDTASTKIANNNATISANQASLADAFKKGDGSQSSVVTAIGKALDDAKTARDGIATAAGVIDTEAGRFANASTGYVQVVGMNATALNTAIGQKTSATTNLVQLNSTLGQQSSTPANGPIADFITVNDITVKLGNIRTSGDVLEGTGQLNAPGDAQIDIVNNTPNFLKLKNLTVNSDDGGTVRFNGVLVNSGADIDRINSTGTGASALQVLTRDTSAAPKPSINITSTYDATAAGATVLAPAPNIELAGDISNLRGSVTVKSAAGSILSNGSIRAGTVDIKADNGDFVQSYVDNFFHVGGDPASIKDNGTPLGGGIVANGSVFLSARYLNINSLVQSGIADWKIDLPAAPKLTGTASFFGLAQSALDNAVTAYNNATGAAKDTLRYTTYTVAAGVVTYDALLKRLEVGMDFAKADRTTADWATRTAVSGGLYQLVSDYGNIGASYDVVNNRFELDGTQVSGGYIQVYGQIMNTSTNGSGTLRALDGYGQIVVNNPTGLSVVINKLDTGKDSTGTGRGIAGIIDITDIQSIGNGSQLVSTHTVYKRENGVLTVNGQADTHVLAGTDGRATTYAPQTGLRYAWTTGTDNSTISYWHYKGAQFFGSSSLRTGPTGEVVSQSGPFILDSYRLDNGTYLYTDKNKTGTPYTQNAETHKTGDSLWVKTDEWSTCNWWTLCIAGNYHQKFTETTPTTTITTKTLTADNKINIEFHGANTGTVTVNSAADVLLKGEIRNSSGTTTVNAGSGVTPVAGVSTADRSIVQLNDTALVTGKDIVLNATGNVGGALGNDPAKAIAVAVNGGKLDAAAAQGNVDVEQTVGTLNVGRVTAGGSALDGKGRVTLRSDGSIVAANGATSLIQGDRVDLTSQNGAIGGIAAPLKVNVGYSDDLSKRGLFGLRASAQGDIGIETQAWSGNTAGHLLVDTVVSTGGDVLLKAPGRIIDNNPIESVDTRTWNELLAFWDASGLRAGTAENAANQAQAMKSFEQGLTQEYKLYWQIRSTQPDAGAYDPAFKYQASAAERQGLTVAGQTPQQSAAAIAAFETERTASYHALNEKVGGFSASYDSGFRYQASTAERDAILAKSSWTDRELGISISAGLLKDVTNTNPVVKSANVSGRNVTLQAGIAIGETQGAVVVPTDIDPRNLTDAMKVALASAERSDIVVTDGAITVLRRAPVNFSALNAFNASVTAAPVAGTDIGSAFLASMGSARLGTIDVTGETRIKVRGSITNALPSSGLVQTGNLVLEAAYGGIGYVPGDGVNAGQSQPLRLKLRDGATLTARASDNIEIEEEGDLHLDTVFSRQTAKLTAEGSILDAIGDNGLNVLASNVDLTARNGSIGAAGTGALDVGVTGTAGRITAQAAQDIHLNGPRGRYLNFGDVTSGGSASLSGDVDLRLYGAVQAAGAVDLSAGLTLAMAPTASVRSTASNLKLSAGELTMADGATLRGDVGTVRIDTLTDATITGISTGNGTADAVRIKAGGSVYDGGDTKLDIVADAAPAAGVTIEAGGDIGKGNALEMRLRHLEGSAGGSADFAVAGDVAVGRFTSVDSTTLTATGSIATTALESKLGGVALVSTGGNIDAGSTVAFGDVRLQSDVGRVTAGSTQAGGKVALVATAGSVQATDTTAGGRLDVTAAQDIALGTAKAGGDIVLAAGRALTAGTLASTAGDIRARATTGDLRTGSTTSTAGNVTLVADAGDVAAGRTQAGGHVALIASAGSVQADATTAGGRIEATAARDIALTTAAAGGDIALAAGRNLAATTLSSLAGDIRASAATGDLRTDGTTSTVGNVTLVADAGNVAAGRTQAGGNVVLTATAGSVQADATTAGGRIDIAAAEDIGVNRATAGGDIVLAAGRDLQATTLVSTGGGIQATTGRDLTIGTASAQRDIVLDAGRHLTAGTLTSTQGSVIAKARTGNLRIGTLDAALDGVLSAPLGEVAVERVKAGRDFTLEARNDVDVREGSAGGTFTLSSTGGNATAGTLTADAVVMRAPGRVQADRLNVVSLFDLAGDRVNANIHGGAKPVKGTVTGFNGGIASDVVLALSGQGGFAIDRFKARTAAISNPVGPLSVDSMLVVDRATVTNPQTHVVIDQHDRSIQPGADVQIFSFGAPFSFSLYDNHAFTNAYVIFRSSQHDQIADMGLNRSAVEFSELALSMARTGGDPTLEARQGTEGQDLRPVRYSGVPVKLDGDCSKNLVPECTR